MAQDTGTHKPTDIAKTSSNGSKEPHKKSTSIKKTEEEFGGREGPEPTRYGDWEKNGIISDF